MKEVVWGMIGCGDVTEKKTGPPLYKIPNSRLKGVYNRTQARAEDWVARHGHGTVYESIEALLADPEINAVYIATPPASHHPYAIQALQAGKIPLIEKPMASTFEQCQEIMAVAEKENLPVFINFYRRGLEKIMTIKQLLEDGAIGEPLVVESRHFRQVEASDLNPDQLPWRVTKEAGGGKALDTQVHVLDYLQYFFGNIETMTGVAENRGGYYEVEDTITASFQFENRVVGTAAWCYVADLNLDEIRVTGTKGQMVFSGTGVTDLTVNGETLAFESPEHVAMPFMEKVVDELLGKGPSPADTTQAAHVIQVFDQLLETYRKMV